MPIVSDEAIKLATKNVASYGDTDIFPFPVENHIFHDKPTEVISILKGIDKEFDAAMVSMPLKWGLRMKADIAVKTGMASCREKLLF